MVETAKAVAVLLMVVAGLLVRLGIFLSANRRLAADKLQLDRDNTDLRQRIKAIERTAAQMPQQER